MTLRELLREDMYDCYDDIISKYSETDSSVVAVELLMSVKLSEYIELVKDCIKTKDVADKALLGLYRTYSDVLAELKLKDYHGF